MSHVCSLQYVPYNQSTAALAVLSQFSFGEALKNVCFTMRTMNPKHTGRRAHKTAYCASYSPGQLILVNHPPISQQSRFRPLKLNEWACTELNIFESFPFDLSIGFIDLFVCFSGTEEVPSERKPIHQEVQVTKQYLLRAKRELFCGCATYQYAVSQFARHRAQLRYVLFNACVTIQCFTCFPCSTEKNRPFFPLL